MENNEENRDENTVENTEETSDEQPQEKDWKAEYASLKRDFKKTQKELESLKNPPKEEAPSKPDSNEPDYGKLAFLNSMKVNHPDDQKVVMEEAQRLKLSLNDVLGMEHIKAKLKNNQDQREAQDGTPEGGKRGGGKSAKTVDYWIANGGLPDDQELAEKVVDARMGKERGKKFADQMFNE